MLNLILIVILGMVWLAIYLTGGTVSWPAILFVWLAWFIRDFREWFFPD